MGAVLFVWRNAQRRTGTALLTAWQDAWQHGWMPASEALASDLNLWMDGWMCMKSHVFPGLPTLADREHMF